MAEPRKIVVEEEELAEYARCALRHLYRFRFEVSAPDPDRMAVYLKSLRGSIIHLYSRIADRTTPLHLQEVFQDFDRRMTERAERAGIRIEDLADLLALGRIRLKAHFEHEERGLIILGTEIPYERSFKREEVEVVLRGKIDLVRVRNDHAPRKRRVEAVHLSTRRVIPGPAERANSIELVCARLGLSTFGNFSKGRNTPVRMIWYALAQDQEAEADIGEHELRGATGWLVNIAEAIDRGLYYPQFETLRCAQCPYRPGCDPEHSSTTSRLTPLIKGEELARRMKAGDRK